MSRMIDLIRRVVQQELASHRTSLLGVVTTVFPHTTKDDENNYEANVRLKHEDLELRKVPLAIAHMGAVLPPKVGDLVLVQFINGDLNQPVITSRFYHADERPPLHQENDILFEQRVPDDTLNHLRFTNNGTIYLQRDVQKPEDNSEAKTSIKIDGESGDIQIKAGKITIEVTHDKAVKITDAKGSFIEMTEDVFNITSKVPFKIDAAGQAVEIIGNTIDFNKG